MKGFLTTECQTEHRPQEGRPLCTAVAIHNGGTYRLGYNNQGYPLLQSLLSTKNLYNNVFYDFSANGDVTNTMRLTIWRDLAKN